MKDRILALVSKEFYSIKNSIKSLLLTYAVYIVILYMIKDFAVKIKRLPEGLVIIVAIIFFLNLGILFTINFLKRIYEEVALGKEEVYFAYGYNVFELCFGKAIVYTILSILIPFVFVVYSFSFLLKSNVFLVNLLLLLPIFMLIINYIIILTTWFYRLGTAVFFGIFFFVFYSFGSGIKTIIKSGVSIGGSKLIFYEIFLIFILIIASFGFTKAVRKEKLIEKLR